MPVPTLHQAWQRSLYGPRGFYRRPEGPAGHFATATHGPLGALLAEAVAALADQHSLRSIVDFACGRGELLAHLAEQRPDLTLTGVEIVGRPSRLPDAVAWLTTPGGAALPTWDLTEPVLLLAHEWLDVVPCPVAEVDAAGRLRVVLADGTVGAELDGHDRTWADAHWPDRTPGTIVEIGLTRDLAWQSLLDRLPHGSLAVAVDYGHERDARPSTGTLTGFRAGHEGHPALDGSTDVTAHVAVDTLRQQSRHRQRALLTDLLSAPPPAHTLASTAPLAYVEALSRRGALAQLTASGGFGDFWWVLAAT